MLREMSAKQTEGCPFPEEKMSSVARQKGEEPAPRDARPLIPNSEFRIFNHPCKLKFIVTYSRFTITYYIKILPAGGVIRREFGIFKRRGVSSARKL